MSPSGDRRLSGPTPDPVPWEDRLRAHGARLAVVDPDGEHTYADLLGDARRIADRLLGARSDLDGDRVAVLCRPGRDFVTALLGCWLAGGFAVPLHPDHPVAELRHPVEDSGVSVALFSPAFADTVAALVAAVPDLSAIDLVGAREAGTETRPLPVVAVERPSMMLYTSGTTGRPKGVVHTHRSVVAQIHGMVDAWGWLPDDRIVLVLPLHHVHGIVNVTLCALWCGAVCEAPGGFDAEATWERLASGERHGLHGRPDHLHPPDRGLERRRRRHPPTLVRTGRTAPPHGVRLGRAARRDPRPLGADHPTPPPRALRDDRARDGAHQLPRRPGPRPRRARPSPASRCGWSTSRAGPWRGETGELLVRGPRASTGTGTARGDRRSFVDGWFRTGDVAIESEQGFRLLGPASVDILKTGGEKVSALEIEEAYRAHPAIADCAVVGIPATRSGVSGSASPSSRRTPQRHPATTTCGRGARSGSPPPRCRACRW